MFKKAVPITFLLLLFLSPTTLIAAPWDDFGFTPSASVEAIILTDYIIDNLAGSSTNWQNLGTQRVTLVENEYESYSTNYASHEIYGAYAYGSSWLTETYAYNYIDYPFQDDRTDYGIAEMMFTESFSFTATQTLEITLGIDYSATLNLITTNPDDYADGTIGAFISVNGLIVNEFNYSNFVSNGNTDSFLESNILNTLFQIEAGQDYTFVLGNYSMSYASTSPVPIPGAFWLMGSGLLGIVGLKRRLQ